MLVGSFVAKTVTATGKMSFHYDEALQQGSMGGNSSRRAVSSWNEMRMGTDSGALKTETGGFLP